MKHPSHWTKADLHHHLQHALNLELWTIPLYLTALYSIKGLRKQKHKDYPEAAKLILSVVVQEMLHMELVCNISNALGFQPKFSPPCYDEEIGIPFIHPSKNNLPEDLHGYPVKPHALNKESLQLFCAIELPHPNNVMDWENEKSYNSIADLYEAHKMGINALWDSCYVGNEKNLRQKNTFNEYHNSNGRSHGFSQVVNSKAAAFKAIEAIIEQGEGANSKQVPADFRPHHLQEGMEFETAWYKGNLSHYQKFRILLHSHHKLPAVYTIKNQNNNSESQMKMKNLFLDFLNDLEIHFNSDGEQLPDSFWNKMFMLGDAIAAVWESGTCPDFKFN